MKDLRKRIIAFSHQIRSNQHEAWSHLVEIVNDRDRDDQLFAEMGRKSCAAWLELGELLSENQITATCSKEVNYGNVVSRET